MWWASVHFCCPRPIFHFPPMQITSLPLHCPSLLLIARVYSLWPFLLSLICSSFAFFIAFLSNSFFFFFSTGLRCPHVHASPSARFLCLRWRSPRQTNTPYLNNCQSDWVFINRSPRIASNLFDSSDCPEHINMPHHSSLRTQCFWDCFFDPLPLTTPFRTLHGYQTKNCYRYTPTEPLLLHEPYTVPNCLPYSLPEAFIQTNGQIVQPFDVPTLACLWYCFPRFANARCTPGPLCPILQPDFHVVYHNGLVDLAAFVVFSLLAFILLGSVWKQRCTRQESKDAVKTSAIILPFIEQNQHPASRSKDWNYKFCTSAMQKNSAWKVDCVPSTVRVRFGGEFMDLPCRLLLSSCFEACLKVTSAVMLRFGLFPCFLSHYFRSLFHLSLSFF